MDVKDVIKHSATIQMTNKINLLQRQAWNVLLANAYCDLPKKDTYTIRLKELTKKLKFDSRNEKHLKTLLKDLVGCVVEWNVFNRDKEIEWGATTLLSFCLIKDGVCTYRYDPVLRENLYHPRLYARINLLLQQKFKSKHALALYEFGVDTLGAKREYCETTFIPVEEFRKLLGIIPPKYKKFKDFNHYVIKEPVEEINTVSDISMEPLYKREGRKVGYIKLCIRRISEIQPKNGEPNWGNFLTPPDKKLIEAPEKGKPLEEKLELNQNQRELFDHLRAHKLSDNQAYGIIEKYDKNYILENLEMVLQKFKEGKVNNLGAYTLKALEEDFREKKSPYEIEQEKLEEERKRKIEQKKRNSEIVSNLQNEFDEVKNNKVKEILESLPKKEQEKVILEFELEMKNNNSFLWGHYQKNKLKSLFVKEHYKDFVAQKFLLEPEEKSFVVYAKLKGYEVVKNKKNEYVINV